MQNVIAELKVWARSKRDEGCIDIVIAAQQSSGNCRVGNNMKTEIKMKRTLGLKDCVSTGKIGM
jgi:hypothetical protein